MKKKFKYICLCGISALLLSGCGIEASDNEQSFHEALEETYEEVQKEEAESYELCDRFAQIDGGTNFNIIYDRVTHVVYAVSDGHDNRGVFTPLLDAEGKPLSYEEYIGAEEADIP